jgi:hypothetical protein
MRIGRLLVVAGVVFVSVSAPSFVVRAQELDPDSTGQPTTCNGSIRSAEARKETGSRLFHGGMVGMLASVPIAISATSDLRRPASRSRMEVAHYLGLTGIAAQFSGLLFLHGSVKPAAEWDDALQHLAIGEATMSQVETCLGQPRSRPVQVTNRQASDSLPAETAWEYRALTRNSILGKSRHRVVTISFRDSIVSGIKVTETR